MKAIALLFLMFCALAAGQAKAVSVSDEVVRCSELESRLERLDCYDRIAEAIKQGDVVRLPIEDLEADIETFENSDNPTNDTIRSTITELERLPMGEYQITLANGQVWREVEASIRSRYRIGDEISISPALLGSFRLRVNQSGYSNKVKRVE